MKKLAILLCVLTAFACKKTVNAEQEKPELQSSTIEKSISKNTKLTSLFDGTNLDQWRGYNTKTIPAEWTIEDGALAFIPGTEGGKNIISKEQYTNFVLSLEWKISEGGNSGIFWGVHESEEFNEAYETGPEIQVLDDAKHPDAFVAEGTHKAGSLYDMIKAPEGLIKPAGEWNEIILKVNHKINLAKVSINGTAAYSFPVHGSEWDAMVADSKFKDWKGFGKYQTGYIGLQDHGDRVWYRNINIQPIN